MDIYKAKVLATGEKLTVYKLANGSWYDHENMEQDAPPAAPKANKKEFRPNELQLNKRPFKSV